MNQMLRKAATGYVTVPLPEDMAPSSITATLYSSDGPDSDAVFEDRAVDVVAYELNADAAVNATELTVDWGTSRVLRPEEEAFLAAASDPHKHPVETIMAKAVDGTTLSLDGRLLRAWSTGAKLYPKVVRVPLTAEDTASLDRDMRLVLTIVFDGLEAEEATRKISTMLDVVDHIPRCTLTLSKLRRQYPTLYSELQGRRGFESSGWETTIGVAWDHVIDDCARNLNKKPDLIYSDEQLEQSVIARMRWLRAEDGTLYPQDTDRLSIVDDCRKNYNRVFDEFLQSIGFYDTDEDQTPDEGEIDTSRLPRYLVLP